MYENNTRIKFSFKRSKYHQQCVLDALYEKSENKSRSYDDENGKTASRFEGKDAGDRSRGKHRFPLHGYLVAWNWLIEVSLARHSWAYETGWTFSKGGAFLSKMIMSVAGF